MPGFLKVRAVVGPKHIFYAPVESVTAWPEDYEVLDETPVEQPGEVEYETTFPAAEWAKANKEASSKASAVVDKSVGDEKEGDA